MGEMNKPGHLELLENWMRSYRPDELFDAAGKLRAEIAELAPKAERRMSANPHANGGLLLRDLNLPDFRDYAVAVPTPGAVNAEATRKARHAPVMASGPIRPESVGVPDQDRTPAPTTRQAMPIAIRRSKLS